MLESEEDLGTTQEEKYISMIEAKISHEARQLLALYCQADFASEKIRSYNQHQEFLKHLLNAMPKLSNMKASLAPKKLYYSVF